MINPVHTYPRRCACFGRAGAENRGLGSRGTGTSSWKGTAEILMNPLICASLRDANVLLFYCTSVIFSQGSSLSAYVYEPLVFLFL